MAIERKDSIKDQTQSTGTGSVTLDLVTTAGYRAMSAHTNGATVRYRIYNATNTEWEIGEGVWTSPTLTRVTIFASSNNGALVNFSVGQKIVMTVPVAMDFQAPTYIGSTQPTDTVPYLWIQTGLGDDGTGFTFWINDAN
jgi:hypothetical protein